MKNIKKLIEDGQSAYHTDGFDDKIEHRTNWVVEALIGVALALLMFLLWKCV